MYESVEKNITAYINYFRYQIDNIEDQCSTTRDGNLYARILYTAIIDSLSRMVFRQESNRDRFVKFVCQYCDWSDCTRVSLPHLYRLVANKPNANLSMLKKFATQNIGSWRPAEKIVLNRDPSSETVEELWPKVNNKMLKIDGIWIKWIQHVHLLYTYRNHLVHEFQTPGRHVELWDLNEPYYAYLVEYENDNSVDKKRSWELQYPAKFFKRLGESGLSNLRNYLFENHIDPYINTDRGNYWIDELNS